MRERVLVIDGDPSTGATLRDALRDRGFDAALASLSAKGIAFEPGFTPAAVIGDAALPGLEGAALVERLRRLAPEAAVVACVPPERTDAAVAALRAGAERHLVKPVHAEQAVVAVEKALETRRLARDGAALRARLRERLAVVGASPELLAALEVVRRVAPTKAPVLIRGEAGTGKSHLAQALHEASPRRGRPFVRVSCAALSERLLDAELFGEEEETITSGEGAGAGKFRAADGGTLYLQEVSRLSPAVQVKLLRVLQSGEVERPDGRGAVRADVRVVAGTQCDLAEEVRAGRFRDDLYYRLDVVTAILPPLRERKADIPALASHFLGSLARAPGEPARVLAPGALSALFAHGWPGNVRELEDELAAAGAAAEGREIGLADLSPVLQGAWDGGRASVLIPGATLEEIEREAILRTLDEVGGSTSRAAEVLGVSVRKIQYRLKEYRGGVAPAGAPGHRAPLAAQGTPPAK